MTRAARMSGLSATAMPALRTGLAVGVALVLLVSVGAAQAPATPPSDTVTVPKKSAAAATLLSVLLPGTGHFYAEDKRRGSVLLAMPIIGWAIGAGGENGVSAPGILLIGLPWWYAVIDAHNAVARYNRRRASRVSVVPWVTPGRLPWRSDPPAVGIALSLAR